MTTEEYLALIPSQHRDKPRFVATVEASAKPFVDIQTLLLSMPQAFDIDEAVGAQLDAVGECVGRGREVDVPLTGVYFTWGVDGVGWGQGYWYGVGAQDYGITVLPDDPYRMLLKAKIKANGWRGDKPGAYAILRAAFGDSGGITISDDDSAFKWGLDGHGWGDGYWQSGGSGMSMTVTYPAIGLDAVQRAMIETGLNPIKPAGVQATYQKSG